MRSVHCIRAVAVSALALAFAAGAGEYAPAAAQETRASTLTVFLRGMPVGNEQASVSRTADGWTITSSGRIGPPIDATARRIEIRYTADWQPRQFLLDGTARGLNQSIHTIVTGNEARTEITTSGQKTEKTDTVDPASLLILPNTFFAPFEAISIRVRNATPGTDIPVYAVPSVAFSIRVIDSTPQQIQTTSRLIAARRSRIQLTLPGNAIDGEIWSDETGRMIRLTLPAQFLDVVREDVASVSSRSVPISRPNDEPIKIPANGFVLAGTLSKPAQAPAGKLPAVVLVGGSGPTDRDGVAFGIPILGEIAGALADSGFAVARYDKRGIGQSGGRAEAAGLTDYAEDLRAAVKYLSERKDIDPNRIAVIGHSEGGTVALMAAAKEKRIKVLAVIATPGTTGAELILAQQRHVLERSTMSSDDKQAKIDLQKQIHAAVLSGKGLDQLPADVRKAADNAEFQSILSSDPAKIMPEVRQPLLIVQGGLDTQVEPSNAARLEALAGQRKKQPSVETVKIPGTNHLLIPAKTGEIDEYGTLPERHVNPAVTQALAAWLKKTL